MFFSSLYVTASDLGNMRNILWRKKTKIAFLQEIRMQKSTREEQKANF